MKKTLFIVLVAFAGIAFANQALFVQLYDAGKFDEAAKQIDGLDESKADIARRLGVMYYTGQGIAVDKEKGRNLLERAMQSGDAKAAVNLTKIYFMVEKNKPKAAWCLMRAEECNDQSVKDDVTRLREHFGGDYRKSLASYIVQLRDRLTSEQAALKKVREEFDRERASLTAQISARLTDSKKKDEAFARERTELASAKMDLGVKLAAAEEKIVASQKKIQELGMQIAEASLKHKSILNKFYEELSASTNNASAKEKEIEKLKKVMAEITADTKKTEEKIVTANANHKDLLDKYNALVRKWKQYALDSTNELEVARSAAEESEQKHKTLWTRYSRTVKRYNDLARAHNKLLKAYKDELPLIKGFDLDGNEIDLEEKPQVKEDNKGASGPGRGIVTIIFSPFNFFRAIPATGSLYDWAEKSMKPFEAFWFSAICFPGVICCETVPTVCDIVNGSIDILTLGTYGDYIYSGNIESLPFDRSNSHFPWLDRD